MKHSVIPENILIIRTDRIGDVVLTTPTIKALRLAYPQAKISLLVAPFTKSLIEDNPYLDEILVDDRKGEHRGVFGFWKLVGQLRQNKYDLAIVLHTKKRINALCFFAGIPKRIGYKDNKFGFLLTDPIVDVRYHGKKHEAQYCLDVLKPLGIQSEDLELSVSVLKEEELYIKNLFQKQNIKKSDKIIAIHPGASDPAKCWSEKCFAELVDAMYDKYQIKCIMVGADNVQDSAKKIGSLVRSPIINFSGKTSLAGFVAILNNTHMLISNDSGPVHIASAFNLPVVSIFTRNQPGINPKRWRPLGLKSKVVSPKNTQEITVCEVLEAVDALWEVC